MKKILFIIGWLLLSWVAFAQNKIVAYEYWMDNKHAEKYSQTIAPVETFHFQTTIPCQSLEAGIHTLHTRFKDSMGYWSPVTSSYFYKMPELADNKMVAYEYWLDEQYIDRKQEAVTPSATIHLSKSFTFDKLSSGIHTFHIRFKDEHGNWSPLSSRHFYKMPELADNKMVAYEYWFEDDYEFAVKKTIEPTETLSLINIINADEVVSGERTFYIRFMDSHGNWSPVAGSTFTKKSAALEVYFPDSISMANYRNLKLELTNVGAQSNFNITTTDNRKYNFGGLSIGAKYRLELKNNIGVVIGKIDSILINEGINTVHFANLLVPHTVKLRVLANANNLTSQVGIQWYDVHNNLLAQADSVSGQVAGSVLKYRIILNELLGSQYRVPDVQTDTLKEGIYNWAYTLQLIDTLSIRGRVVDVQSNLAVADANITLTQMVNGKYSVTKQAKTDAQGRFILNVQNAAGTLNASHSDYITQKIEKEYFSEADLGTIALKPISGVSIATNYSYTPSVVLGETATSYQGYTDYQNVDYAVFNVTQNKAVDNISVQYPLIVLLDTVNAHDNIRLTATSRNEKFEPLTITTKVDETLHAEANINIVQHGSFKASYNSSFNASNVALLYNSSGEFVAQYTYFNQTANSGELPDGKYSLVSMGGSRFFSSISYLQELTNVGLKKGVDYVLDTFSIVSGRIKELNITNIPLFDETKFYYTGNNTLFSVNKTTTVVGNYITPRVQLDFKEEYAGKISNIKLIVDLPAACEYVSNSLTSTNKAASASSRESNSLIIPLVHANTVVRFCVMPTQSGDYTSSAFIAFDLDGKTIRQPIGSANFTATGITINVPSTTAQAMITARGTAKAKSKVTVYDNGKPVGQTTTLADGTWSHRFELQDKYSFSYHDIHADIFTDEGFTLVTDVKQVVYNANHIELSKITMYNLAHPATSLAVTEFPTVFDFLDPENSTRSYPYWPMYPEFRFEVKFTENDPEKVTDVQLYVLTSSGKTRSYTPVFDDSLRAWVAIDSFDMYNLPVNVNAKCHVEYIEIDVDAFLDEFFNGVDSSLINKIEILIDNDEHIQYLVDIDNEIFYIDYCKFTFQNMNKLIEQIQDFGFTKSSVDDLDNIFVRNNSLIFFNIDSLSISSFISSSEKDVLDIISSIKAIGSKKIWPFSESKESKAIQARRDMVFRKIQELVACPKLLPEIRDYLIEGQRSVRGRLLWLYSVIGVSKMADYLTYVPSETGIPQAKIGDKLKKELPNIISTILHLENQVLSMGNPCNDDPDYPNQNTNPQLDPSGYVYEAVPSNRLEGVTTTIYYKTQYEDIYGDKHDTIMLWKAEEYHQKNPLTTNAYGEYMWDVPEGLWQVKYEKEGYQTVYSEWLPVPPPQLDVNVGMVQAVQPNVKKVQGYEEGIIVRFDKYMLPALLNTDNIFVRRNGAKEQDSVAMLNAEDSPANADEQFVSNVRYIPQTPFKTTDTVFLTVKWRVQSYAGTEMGKDTVIKVPIEIEPKTITATQELNLAYNETENISVSVLPVEAGKGKRILLRPVSSSIASVASTVVLDNQGKATIPVSGKLTGTTLVQVSLDETDLQTDVKVHVGMPIAKLIKPKSSIASQTRVNKYTKVALSSNSIDASIYYTTSTATPLDTNSFVLYTDSLQLTKDVTITAFAKKDGMRTSDWAEFIYQVNSAYQVTVKTNNNAYGNVSGSGEYNPNQIVNIEATPNEHYHFVKWNDGNTDNPRTVKVTQDSTFTAIFEKVSYTISATANANGSITPSGDSLVAYGNNITYAITPNSGYKIKEVLIDSINNESAVSSGTYTFENVSTNHTIVATFENAGTGIKELNSSQNIVVIYPNPTTGKLTISHTEASTNKPIGEVQILNTSGKLLMQKTIEEPKAQIDISHLPNGTYLVKIGATVTKVVKQ